MNPENIALITQYLDKIGEKLGLTAGHLWPVFVRQQIVEFYVSIFCVFLCAVVFFPLVIYTVRNWNRSDSSSNSSIEGQPPHPSLTVMGGVPLWRAGWCDGRLNENAEKIMRRQNENRRRAPKRQ